MKGIFPPNPILYTMDRKAQYDHIDNPKKET